MASFQIPKHPDELLDPDSECLHVKQLTNLSELAPQDLLSFAESKGQEFRTRNSVASHSQAFRPEHAGVVYDICEHDALCISEQGVFDGVYSLVRCVSWVQGLPA